MKVGIIGCGKIAQTRHIPEYLHNEKTEIVGYFDLDYQRTQELAARNGGTAYRSREELLANKEIDAVSICTANNSHAQDAIASLNAGKHVLCEKPMATSMEDCLAMVEAAKKNGLVLMIDQNQRLLYTHVYAKKLISEGAIGRVLTFKTTFGHGGPETWSIDPGVNTWFFDASKAAMGALADLGVHKTDLIQYLVGQRVVATTARIVTLDKKDANGDPIGVDDNAICVYEMDGGAVGTMTASWTYYGAEDNSTIIYGKKGIMRIYDDPECSLKIVRPSGAIEKFDLDHIQTNDAQTSTGIIDAFIESVTEGKAPIISAEAVMYAMKVIFASIQSSREGVRVVI